MIIWSHSEILVTAVLIIGPKLLALVMDEALQKQDRLTGMIRGLSIKSSKGHAIYQIQECSKYYVNV